MRELHVVALSADGKHLVLSAKKGSLRGTYLVAVGSRLTKALNGDLREPDEIVEPEPPAESALSPKEIQARLRAGQSPDRVARAAGVPVERITRFEGPVLSERAVILDAARAATFTRQRSGSSAAPLGEAVAANLVAKGGGRPDADAWDTYRRADGRWVIRLEVPMRGRIRRCEWLWDPTTRTMTTSDPYAAGLGHVAQPVRRPARRAKAAPPSPRRRTR